MTTTFAKLAGLAGILSVSAAMVAPYLASDQSYGNRYSNDGSYAYDGCRRATTSRSTTGALVGTAIGAIIGSNVAARGVRTEGAVLGGLVGAAVGSGVGKSSAACGSQNRQGYYDNSDRSNQYGQNGYYDNGYSSGNGYNNGYYAGASNYDNDDGYAYDRSGTSYRVTSRSRNNGDSCTLAESPIYLPDGRVQKRFVRVCRDDNGRYQVVE